MGIRLDIPDVTVEGAPNRYGLLIVALKELECTHQMARLWSERWSVSRVMSLVHSKQHGTYSAR
jgi:hypothetical protein